MDGSSRAEIDLVRAAQSGDRRAFTALVRKYQNAVGAIAYSLTGRFNVSEDVAQETFIVTWRRLAEIREPGRFRSFLFGVARRSSLRAIRDRGPGGETALSSVADELPSSDPSPLDSAISREECVALWRALKGIPEIYRVPLVLFYGDRHAIRDVARILGTNEQNAKKRLSRGRQMLQRHVLELLEKAFRENRFGGRFTAGIATALLAAGAPSKALARTVVATAVAVGVAGVLYLGARPGQVNRAVPAPIVRPSPPVPVTASLVGADRRPDVVPPSPPPARYGPVSIVDLDFESREGDPDFEYGIQAECPPGTGLPRCLGGTVLLNDDGYYMMVGGVPRTETRYRFAYAKPLVVSFDYWHAAKKGDLSLQIRNGDRNENFSSSRGSGASGRWAHAEFPLSELQPNVHREVALVENDAVTNLYVSFRATGDDGFDLGPFSAGFFVKNLRVETRQ